MVDFGAQSVLIKLNFVLAHVFGFYLVNNWFLVGSELVSTWLILELYLFYYLHLLAYLDYPWSYTWLIIDLESDYNWFILG